MDMNIYNLTNTDLKLRLIVMFLLMTTLYSCSETMSDSTTFIDNENENETRIPKFVLSDAEETFNRITNWEGEIGEDVFLLGLVTDVHSIGDEYKFVGYLNVLHNKYHFDIMCNCGDIGLDVPETNNNPEKEFDLLWSTRNEMYDENPWIFCKGNHERVLLQTTGYIFNYSLNRNNPIRVFGDSFGNYGYVDNSGKRIRTYFLNTSDMDYNGYFLSDKQLVWFVETIKELSEGWGVIITSHMCIDDIGRCNSYPNDADCKGMKAMREILEAYANKTSVTIDGYDINTDFTNIKSNLICVLSGDSHFNNQINRNGVNYIVRQGYGWVSESDMPDGATFYPYDIRWQCCYDVLAVKKNGTAKIFRIGVGGEDVDYEFSWTHP